MNLHHLELFYYTARAGGITRACAQMPYGIQQPALSSQLIALERELGLRLFQRKPFQLTPAGQRLYEHLAPFFGSLGDLAGILRGEYSQQLRLVALGELLKDHIPDLLTTLRQKFPTLKAQLYERNQQDAIALVERGEADLAVTVREAVLPPGFRSCDLARLPMVLLLPQAWKKVRQTEDFFTGKVVAPLVALPLNEVLTRQFNAELLRRGWRWPIAIEASGVELVAHYVAQGMGVGLSVTVPQGKLPSGVRALPLNGFPDIVVMACWRGELREPGKTFLELIEKRAKKLSGKLRLRTAHEN